MEARLQESIKRYVNERAPLGPADAHDIKDAEVAAHLFDPHNSSFNTLLRKDISVLLGRRGSGKTALLNSYRYYSYLKNSKGTKGRPADFDLRDYQIVIPMPAHTIIEKMEGKMVGPAGLLRPIETVIEHWSEVVGDFLLAFMLPRMSKDAYIEGAQLVQAYFAGPDARDKLEAYQAVWGTSLFETIRELLRGRNPLPPPPARDDAFKAALDYLARKQQRAVIIIDSLDEYEVGNATLDRMIGALLRFVGRFNAEYDRVKMKLGLPSEIFPEVQRASANPLKDFVSFDQVRWTAPELAQIAAYRYRLFLNLFDGDGHAGVADIDLNNREGVREFWSRFFPELQTNTYGGREDAMTYMLRHTQLLPRQLFRILQRVVQASHQKTGGYRMLTTDAVSESIVNLEPHIAGEILQGFKYIYPHAERLGKLLLANFPTVFSYDDLERKWTRVGYPFMSARDSAAEFVDTMEMLLRMGILGEVVGETDLYTEGRFAYHLLMPFTPGQGSRARGVRIEATRLCIHPVFSRYFSCAGNPHEKSILPQGAAFGFDAADVEQE